jgi:hypothetical protein
VTDLENQIFYVFIAVITVGVAAILWQNYRIWRKWNDDYKKEGEKLWLQRTPLP